MDRLSRYEKLALGATGICVLLCAAMLAGQGLGEQPYRITVSDRGESIRSELIYDETPPSLIPGEKINVNTAPAQELERLPGIGAGRAADIIAYREQHGPFQSPRQLLKVSGIGESTLAGLQDYITTEEE